MTSEHIALQATLDTVLEDFRERFHSNRRAQKLVKKWNRTILLEATDTSELYTLVVADQAIAAIERGRGAVPDEDDYLVHLQAEESVLIDIFSGRYNPSTALLDGMLSVFSNERDKVKLEALAMVLWGL